MLAIFGVHSLMLLADGRLRPLMDVLRIGTDLFLVLSGCLIYHSLQASQPGYGQFLRRRALRILPVFWFMLALYVGVVYQIFPAASKLPQDGKGWLIVENAVLIPLAFHVPAIITATWTLGYLVLFYVIAYPLRRLRGRAAVAIWCLVAAGFYALLPRAAFLILGVGLWWLLRRACPQWPLFLSAGALLRGFPLPPLIQWAGAGLGALGFCWWALPHARSTGVTAFFGRVSYSYYLAHSLMTLAVASQRLPILVAIPMAFTFSVPWAYMVYVAVERPLSPLTQAQFGVYRPGLKSVAYVLVSFLVCGAIWMLIHWATEQSSLRILAD